jgi:hypothetical protein
MRVEIWHILKDIPEEDATPPLPPRRGRAKTPTAPAIALPATQAAQIDHYGSDQQDQIDAVGSAVRRKPGAFSGGTAYLPLRDLVYGIDVIHPFHPVPITLMDRVHPQVSRVALWLRPPPLADGHLDRPSRLISHTVLPVSRALP